MFSKLVHTSIPSNFIIIPILIISGWWSYFFGINQIVWCNDKSILFSVLPQKVFISPWNGLISLIILIIISFLLIPFTTRYFHGTTSNILPTVFFIALSSQIMWISSQGPSLIALLLFVFISKNLFEVYHQNRAFNLVFNAGILTGLSTLIYFPSALLLIICWVGIVLLRPFSFREFFTVLFAFLLPFIFTQAIFLILDKEQILYSFIENSLKISFIEIQGIKQLFWCVFFALFAFWSITKTFFSGSLKKILTRRYFFTFLVWFILFTILLLSPYSDKGILVFLLIPLSYFAAISVSSIKKQYYADFFILLIIVIQIILQLPYIN